MKTLTYYVATSLDGFIAGPRGEMEWLNLVSDPDENKGYGYQAFYAGIDTVLMGYRTYQTVLGFGQWPYQGKRCLVVAHGKTEGIHPNVELIMTDANAAVRHLKEEGEGHIWLVGGGELAGSLYKAGLVDELILTTMPILIGSGVGLLGNTPLQIKLNLQEVHQYSNGVVQTRYLG